MAMTACVGEILDQFDLLVGERTDLLAVNADRADQFVVLEHRHGEQRAEPPAQARRCGSSMYAGSAAMSAI